MRCAACRFDNPPGFQFCGECGTRLAPSSPPHPRDWRDRTPRTYTPEHLADRILTSRSILEGERKHVTVLFADVKGSLALAERLDPEAWHRILDRFFRILTHSVHQFEGSVNQYTGDGIMALYGAPIAHEDHAQRACHAALTIGRRVRDFADELRRAHGIEFGLRMGLNSGEVVVGAIGDDLRMDYTAQGHVVGLASRAERLAEPGSIYLTEDTARLVHGFFRLRPLGRREVAGASGGLVLFALEAEGDARTRLDRTDRMGASPFVGRSDAIATLEKALRRAQQGQGMVLGVEGAPGVGKSRLCLEFVSRCRQRGLRVAEAHCPAHARTLSHFAMLELLRSFFLGDARSEGDVARRRIEAACGELPDEVREALPDLLVGLGIVASGSPGPRLDGGKRERRLSRLACHAIRARAERETTILLIDDLHWIDAASESFVAALVEVVCGTQAFLLLNFRPEYGAAWMEGAEVPRLGLAPLDRKAVVRLIRDLIGTDPSTRDLPDLVYERVGGNPLFVEESVRSLLESGRLQGDRGGCVQVDPERDLEIPLSVRAVIAARIDRLAAEHKRVLQAASVIGKRFEKAVLVKVVDVAESELDASLRALEEAEFVHHETPYRPADYAFKHPLTQEVASESLLSERRAQLHAAVAQALEESQERLGARADRIAHHWEAANRPHDAALWRYRAGFHVTNLVPRRSRRDRVGH
jgi:class 3 adenylate cyclase